MFRLQNNDSPQPLIDSTISNRVIRKYSLFHLCIIITFLNTIITLILILYVFSLVNNVYDKLNNPNTTAYIHKIDHMINNACIMIPGICNPN